MNRTHNLTGHQLCSVWRNMKTRCYNPNTHNFSNYGGKGITICDLWLHNLTAFYEWSMANGYKHGLTIDRINPDIGYSPDNCRWVTLEIQQRNKSKYKGGKQKYIGVGFIKNSTEKCFASSIRVNKALQYLGLFETPEDAAKARDKYIDENQLIGYRKNFN